MFTSIKRRIVFSSAKAVVHKVPANDSEALKSPFDGIMGEEKMQKLLHLCIGCRFQCTKTWKDVDITK